MDFEEIIKKKEELKSKRKLQKSKSNVIMEAFKLLSETTGSINAKLIYSYARLSSKIEDILDEIEIYDHDLPMDKKYELLSLLEQFDKLVDEFTQQG